MKTFTLAMLFAMLASCANAATYLETLRQCGAEWKASDARKSVEKGKGMAAWQTYRAECVARVGYESAKQRRANKSN